jgi:hypothetical protein
MQIVLSWAELNACRHWGTQRHREHLQSDRERTTQGHVVGMPAIAWRTLADRMMKEVFHPVTGRHRKTRNHNDGVPASRSALTKIERTLARTAMHPALRGQGEEGWHPEILVAWREGTTWSLYPVAGVDPTYFVPEPMEHPQLGPVTVWRPRSELDVEVPGLFPDPVLHSGWRTDELASAADKE